MMGFQISFQFELICFLHSFQKVLLQKRKMLVPQEIAEEKGGKEFMKNNFFFSQHLNGLFIQSGEAIHRLDTLFFYSCCVKSLFQ